MRYDRYQWTKASQYRNEVSQRYEPIQPLFLATLAARLEDATFVDIGANIGAYSVVLGTQKTISRILAFEPNPQCFNELATNISLNRLNHKATCFDIALSDRLGEAEFGFTSDLGGDGGLTESHQFLERVNKRQVVRTKPLDEIFHDVGQEIVVKLDIEGHEINAINGARRTLSENRGFIQVEILGGSRRRAGLISLLGSLGWMPVLRIHNDHYFSNHPSVRVEQDRLEFVEEALDQVVSDSLNAPSPTRRRLLPWLTVEISYQSAQRLKKVLRAFRLKG